MEPYRVQQLHIYIYICEEFICKKTINTTLKKKMVLVKIVKKAGIVHFQGIASLRFTAEADKRPCCF